MKKYTALIVSLMLLIIVTYHYVFYLDKNFVENKYLSIESLIKTKELKKISYGEGEYQKVYKKWIKKTNDLFIEISNNLEINLEHIVIRNYIQYSKDYISLLDEIIRIDPPNEFKIYHENIISEAIAGNQLCTSYLNDIKIFDSIFKLFFKRHRLNEKLFSKKFTSYLDK